MINIRYTHTQGDVVGTVGEAANTGFLEWIVPLPVQEGLYYFVIHPLIGQRRFEVSREPNPRYGKHTHIYIQCTQQE